MKKYNDWSAGKEDYEREVAALTKLRHPNIVMFLDSITAPQPLIIMEYLPLGTMFDLLHDASQAIDWSSRLKMATDVATGMFFMHSAGLVHLDLKSSNLLMATIQPVPVVKIFDFETSRDRNGPFFKNVGTPRWMAPELSLSNKYNGVNADCFSFGVLLWELYTRKVPFEDIQFESTVLELTKKGTRPEIPQDWYTKSSLSLSLSLFNAGIMQQSRIDKQKK